jgi:uncharacterized protein YndB with AHSA1/START domain
MKSLLAESKIAINATVERVWRALLDPSLIKMYMNGMEPMSDWREGSELIWIGRPGEPTSNHAKGVIITKALNVFKYTFFYPGYGLPDQPENYNIVTCTLTPLPGGLTELKASQGDFSIYGEQGTLYRDHSQVFWDKALETLKDLIEQKSI